MKNFIKTLFAVLLGNTIFFGIFMLFFILMMIGAALSVNKFSNSSSASFMSENSTLLLDIKGAVMEMPNSKNSNSFAFGSNTNTELCIHEIIKAIEDAADDEDITSIMIKLNSNQALAYNEIDLIRDELKKFKKSDKPVFAYGEIGSQKSYYLASVADKIYVNPNGAIDLRGFGAQLTFFKKALDKLEVKPDIFYAGKFKSATEPFRLDKMSSENKLQIKELLADISEDVVANIATERGLSPEVVNTNFNTMASMVPREAVASKMIDGAKYQDEVESELKDSLNIDEDEDLNYITLKKYIQNNVDLSADGDIAIYVAEGNIIDGKSDRESVGSATVLKEIRKIREDDDIKGVVLRINSPGGSALASAVMLREIERLRKEKPVVVSMGSLAASGGYYIACEADTVFAEPHTITGSIGVFGIVPNFENMLKNKLGITFDEVELNDHAVFGGGNKSFDAAEKEKIQKGVDDIYMTFKSEVSKGRNMSMDSVEMIAQGRVWSGEKALELGLVHKIGTLHDAIKFMADKIDTKEDDYFFYNNRISEWEEFIKEMNLQSFISGIKSILLKSIFSEKHYDYWQSVENFTKLEGVQASMPYKIELR